MYKKCFIEESCVLYSIEHHLEKIKRKAIEAGYQDNTMIVSGVEHMLKMCVYNHSSPENHIYFTIRLILYILLRRNSFYGLITKVTNKFIEHMVCFTYKPQKYHVILKLYKLSIK